MVFDRGDDVFEGCDRGCGVEVVTCHFQSPSFFFRSSPFKVDRALREAARRTARFDVRERERDRHRGLTEGGPCMKRQLLGIGVTVAVLCGGAAVLVSGATASASGTTHRLVAGSVQNFSAAFEAPTWTFTCDTVPWAVPPPFAWLYITVRPTRLAPWVSCCRVSMCPIVPCATLGPMRRILAAACVLLAACAPDAVNNRAAPGFNGFPAPAEHYI